MTSHTYYLCHVRHLVDLWPLKVGDAVVAGDVADGDVDLGVREELRLLAVVDGAHGEDVGGLEMCAGVVKTVEHRLRDTGMVKIVGPRSRQLARGSQKTGSRNQGKRNEPVIWEWYRVQDGPTWMYPGNLAFV